MIGFPLHVLLTIPYHSLPQQHSNYYTIYIFCWRKKTNMSDLINMFIINTYNHIFVCNSYKTNEMFMPSSKKTLHHHEGKKYFVIMMTASTCHKQICWVLSSLLDISTFSLQLTPCDLLKGFSKILKAHLYLTGFIIKCKWP